MKLFFIDDSNITKEEYLGFFIYGGLIVDQEYVRDLVKKFLKIKEDHGIDFSTEIKWSNINNLDPTKAKILKHDILELVKNSQCKIIVYLAPQNFYHKAIPKISKKRALGIKWSIDSKKHIRALEYATNICLQKFNHYLGEIEDLGLTLADETGLSCKKDMRKYYFSLYPAGTKVSSLDKIVYTIIPLDSCYSQLHQVNDVVIGAIQHSLKEFKYNFLPLLKKNFWSKKLIRRRRIMVTGYGFNVYPKKTGVQRTQEMLNRVSKKFRKLINKKI